LLSSCIHKCGSWMPMTPRLSFTHQTLSQ
jgi:hypothetical protein